MLYEIKGDITTALQGVIAHGVNCRGVMGAGVALAIRTAWPQVYEAYMDDFHNGRNQLNYAGLVHISDDLWVANLYTQLSFGGGNKPHANVQAIYNALKTVLTDPKLAHLPVYVPQIGCGLGGLSWERDVKPCLAILDREYPHRLTVVMYE